MEFYDFEQLYISQLFSHQKAIISVGVFDGLHIGHQHIIKRASQEAQKEKDCDSIVCTFAQNPKMMIGSSPYSKPLLTPRITNNLYQSLGVDKVVVIDFSPDFSKLTGEEFIAKLASLFDVRAIVIGENFRCGQHADTTSKEISEFLHRYTHNAKVIVPHMYRLSDGTIDSSTLVRTMIIKGKVAEISALLGRNYSLDLAHIPSRNDEWPLKVSLGLFVQLLPPLGEYEALLVVNESFYYVVRCKIDDSFLTLTIEEKTLPIKKFAPLRYDRLEFIKELSIKDVN